MDLNWIATFRDGAVMREVDGAHSEYDPPHHCFSCLDRPVRSLGWFNNDRLVAGVLLPDGATPVLFRRNDINLATGLHTTSYFAGWEHETVSEYSVVYPDGSVMSADSVAALGGQP